MPRGCYIKRASCRTGALSALGLLLASCQTLPPAEPLIDPITTAPPVTRGLDAQGLSDLLVAELAGQRGDYQRASRGYLAGAERYGAASLAERAALAARFSNNPQLVELAAQRWQRLAPGDANPSRLLAEVAVQKGDWDTALAQQLDITRRASEIDEPAGSLVAFVESALESGATPAPLLKRLRDFDPPPNREQETRLAIGLLEAANGLHDAARQRLSALANEAPRLEGLWRIRAAVALESGDAAHAEAMARRGLSYLPGDPRLVLLLSQAEIRQGNVSAAEANTNALLEDHGGNADLRQALAQLYLQEGHTQPARRLLLPLTNERSTPDGVFLMLGDIAEQEGEIDNALLYYRQVPEGDRFLPSRASAARMLFQHDRPGDAQTFLRIERLRHTSMAPDLYALEVELLDSAGQPEQAGQLLDRAIDTYPDNTQLRYQRAMRDARLGHLETMERDLRLLIEQQPDNANALNALGYTLADHNVPERLDEARALIEQAHKLSPDNPAILDSMGWVRYRQGDAESALPWLERAWAGMQDQEVAAHLIEVLWALGQRDRARQLLKDAQQRFETRPKIEELLQRRPELRP